MTQDVSRNPRNRKVVYITCNKRTLPYLLKSVCLQYKSNSPAISRAGVRTHIPDPTHVIIVLDRTECTQKTELQL